MTAHRFQAFWPILDEQRTWNDLVREAATELPTLLVQAGARIVGPVRWTITPSAHVAGSGNVAEYVLVCDAPAQPGVRRAYRGAA